MAALGGGLVQGLGSIASKLLGTTTEVGGHTTHKGSGDRNGTSLSIWAVERARFAAIQISFILLDS